MCCRQSKVIRVLNLWQKNQVFPPEVIQPIFDLADPESAASRAIEQQILAKEQQLQQQGGQTAAQPAGATPSSAAAAPAGGDQPATPASRQASHWPRAACERPVGARRG